MDLILYHIFGEKFIEYLLGVHILGALLVCGIGFYLAARLILETFLQPRPRPKK